MTTKYTPLHDRILVRRKDKEAKSKGGIILPDQAQIKNRFAEVVAVGPGRYKKDSLERIPSEVAIGQTVFFRGTAGHEIEVNGEDGYVVLREHEIEAVEEK